MDNKIIAIIIGFGAFIGLLNQHLDLEVWILIFLMSTTLVFIFKEETK
jgi:hypothetical protein